MYKIKIHKSVEKFLDKHPELIKKFIEQFYQIAQNLNHYYIIQADVKPFLGKKNNYRLRIGKYRFLYEVREEEILVWIWKVDSRGGIYK